jgi:hypothetical protein
VKYARDAGIRCAAILKGDLYAWAVLVSIACDVDVDGLLERGPGLRRLSERIGPHTETLGRAVHRLEAVGLLGVNRRGPGHPTGYWLPWIVEERAAYRADPDGPALTVVHNRAAVGRAPARGLEPRTQLSTSARPVRGPGPDTSARPRAAPTRDVCTEERARAHVDEPVTVERGRELLGKLRQRFQAAAHGGLRRCYPTSSHPALRGYEGSRDELGVHVQGCEPATCQAGAEHQARALEA